MSFINHILKKIIVTASGTLVPFNSQSMDGSLRPPVTWLKVCCVPVCRVNLLKEKCWKDGRISAGERTKRKEGGVSFISLSRNMVCFMESTNHGEMTGMSDRSLEIKDGVLIEKKNMCHPKFTFH